MSIRNPSIQTKLSSEHIAAFASNAKIRFADFLDDTSARSLAKAIDNLPPFHRAFASQNQPALVSRSELSALSAEQRTALFSQIYQQAEQGVGYWYARYEPVDNCLVYGQIKQWLNSADLLQMIHRITGDSDLSRASFQVTRFLPGDFLTRHSDDMPSQRRRFAFVLNLAPRWHPDWGGLLQFYTKSGEPVDAWTPGFNTFGLFSVKHIHSVTAVAPFAPVPRLTVSGWFHN